VKRLKQISDQVDFLYTGKLDSDREDVAGQGSASPTAAEAMLAAEAALDKIEEFPVRTSSRIDAEANSPRTWKPRRVFMPIRVAISAKGSTPRPVPICAEAMGKPRRMNETETTDDYANSRPQRVTVSS